MSLFYDFRFIWKFKMTATGKKDYSFDWLKFQV